MIVCNIIIECPWREFSNKEEFKSWITENYVPDEGENINKFREYNFKIAEEHGKDWFSMTFIKPNIIVLTQRYLNWFEYYGCIPFRIETLKMLEDNNFIVKVSEPLETDHV